MGNDTTGKRPERRGMVNGVRNEEPSMGERKRGRPRVVAVADCVVPGCVDGAVCRGMCRTHDRRMRRHGSVEVDKRRKGGKAVDVVEGQTVKAEGVWARTVSQEPKESHPAEGEEAK